MLDRVVGPGEGEHEARQHVGRSGFKPELGGARGRTEALNLAHLAAAMEQAQGDFAVDRAPGDPDVPVGQDYGGRLTGRYRIHISDTHGVAPAAAGGVGGGGLKERRVGGVGGDGQQDHGGDAADQPGGAIRVGGKVAGPGGHGRPDILFGSIGVGDQRPFTVTAIQGGAAGVQPSGGVSSGSRLSEAPAGARPASSGMTVTR